jgi:hypothetical protein
MHQSGLGGKNDREHNPTFYTRIFQSFKKKGACLHMNYNPTKKGNKIQRGLGLNGKFYIRAASKLEI